MRIVFLNDIPYEMNMSDLSKDEELDPMARYRAWVRDGVLIDDAEQRFVVEKLSLLARRMNSAAPKKLGFAQALFGWGKEKIDFQQLNGLYIYGSVGRGKSMLMQLFADALPAQIWRVHFLEFMREIHLELDKLRLQKISDPLTRLAENLAQKHQILCLDEMQVENIADAMILGRLFETLFKEGTLLVTTSNRHPKDLYKSGLNRQRFEPFIALIEKHCELISLDGPTDYRKIDSQDQRYFSPLTVETQNAFEQLWKNHGQISTRDLHIDSRIWMLETAGQNAARVTFSQACEAARGARDYQILASNYKTLFIDEIPRLRIDNTSAANRFITLIDVLYEAKTKLFLRLEMPIEQLHSDKNTAFIFERSLSRLSEMASPKWNA